MSPSEKYFKVLSLKDLTVYKAEQILGFGRNTLANAMARNKELTVRYHNEFMEKFHVKQLWWETGKGDVFEKNVTSVGKEGSTVKEVFIDRKLQVERGEGNKAYLIPFYDTVAVGGLGMLAAQEPLYSYDQEMIDPGTFLRKATGALRVYGHSMFPKYPAGCVVAFKDADMEVILWGEDYVVELSDRRVLKRIEKSDKPETIKLVSYNKSEEYVYADVEVPVAKIKRLYMVVGKVEMEASV